MGTHGKNQQQERQQAEHAAAERAQEKREHKVRRGTACACQQPDALGDRNQNVQHANGCRQNACGSEQGNCPAGKPQQQEEQQQKEEQARIRKRQNELKKTEDRIHVLEVRDKEIDELMMQEEVFTNVAKCVELNKEKTAVNEELEQLYEHWEELAE